MSLALAGTGLARAGAVARSVPYVESDVEPLRTVLLHRPGDELNAVAADPRGVLFTHAPEPARARAEHDAFATTLRTRGVQVLYLTDLLAEVLGEPNMRATFLDLAVPPLAQCARQGLEALPPAVAAHALVAGDTAMGLDALPNMMYTRDQSVWLAGGALLGAMATRARARESRLLAALYRAHPRFAGAPCWSDAANRQPRVEGGDVLALGDGRVMLAISQRTTRTGARRAARGLLATGAAREVVVVALPRSAGFHLDLALTLVDRDAVAVWATLRRALRGTILRATATGITARPTDDPLRWAGRVIEIGDDDVAAHGRSWDRGVNVLALAPGLVVAYDDNTAANQRLEAAGITVIPVAGAALAAGRGGPHCLSCPVVRGGR